MVRQHFPQMELADTEGGTVEVEDVPLFRGGWGRHVVGALAGPFEAHLAVLLDDSFVDRVSGVEAVEFIAEGTQVKRRVIRLFDLSDKGALAVDELVEVHVVVVAFVDEEWHRGSRRLN
jgi:hypothetical protein